MKLLFKQRLLSILDSYDVYNENGEVAYVIKGQFSIGHMLKIYDANGNELGYLKQRILAWLPRFDMHIGGNFEGSIKKEFSFFTPRFSIDYKGWSVEGNWFEWDYQIIDSNNQTVATVSKKLLNFTDTYEIDIANPADALYALMLVLAIDAEKCSRKN